MAINLYNIKKWVRMLTGKSVEHVNQGIGRGYNIDKLTGYYNDLTEKITDEQILDNKGVPLFNSPKHGMIYFPIMIFQYGLGAYDKYLLSYKKDIKMLNKAKVCANWGIENQQVNGSWKNFIDEDPLNPYSSMAQGEGASLLLRIYMESGDEKYNISAKNAIYFMIKDIGEGGTAEYIDNEVYLHEFTAKPTVLNGWIFSFWGIYDYLLVNKDEKINKIAQKTVDTMINNLYKFDNGYWSMYNLGNMITSPFYHKLHIAQLKAMYDLTKIEEFKKYSEIFERYNEKWWNRKRAFVKKAFQKIIEKN